MEWDSNHNYKCDLPFRTVDNSYLDENGEPIPPTDKTNYNNAKRDSEDKNLDGICDVRDYRPGLVSAGGVGRLVTKIKELRKLYSSTPVVYLDSGDTFQGAPQFNLFKGEIEMRTMQYLGVDAMTIGNHEFDNGTEAFVKAYQKSGGFPLLASNYLFSDDGSKGLKNLINPFVILNRGTLKIGVVGIGNSDTLTSASVIGGSLGFNTLDAFESAQIFVNAIRKRVDIVVLLSHQGLNNDYELAEKIKGVDLILGGHHHVILDPVKLLKGPDGRDVLVVHSGVNMKDIGLLEVIAQKRTRETPEIVWFKYSTPKIDDTVPEDSVAKTILEPYAEALRDAQDLDAIIGSAKSTITRNDPNGNDSTLGNIVTDAMMKHEMVRAQFAVTNSQGIRADIPVGSISREKLYEVFPFENSISILYLNGKELKQMFDFIAEKSSYRGCATQIQAAGIHLEIDCSPHDPEKIAKYGTRPITKRLGIGAEDVIGKRTSDGTWDSDYDYQLTNPFGLFKMATNDYMAGGGSGFTMLKQNTTKIDTSISLRDAVIEFIQALDNAEIDPADFSDTNPETRRIRMIN